MFWFSPEEVEVPGSGRFGGMGACLGVASFLTGAGPLSVPVRGVECYWQPTRGLLPFPPVSGVAAMVGIGRPCARLGLSRDPTTFAGSPCFSLLLHF